jgi:hypothetical protein
MLLGWLRAIGSLKCLQALGYKEELPLTLNTERRLSILALRLARFLIVMKFLLLGGVTASE